MKISFVLLIFTIFFLNFPKLQDTLIQREEELARLQEENNNLKEFLNSSCVKALEEKTKVITSWMNWLINFI